MRGPFGRADSDATFDHAGSGDSGAPAQTREPDPLSGWKGFRSQLTLSSLGLEIGIVGACVTAMLTVSRLFTDSSPVITIAVAALLAHGIAVASRWCGLRWVTSISISALVMVLTASGALFPTTARLQVIPTAATLDSVQRSLIESWNTFLTVRAPTEPMLGFTLIGFAGAWLVSTLTDAIAYRLGFLIEALVPSAIVVTLTSALSSDSNRVRVLAPYAASVCVVVGSARVRELARDAWLGGKPRRAGAVGATLFVVTALSAVSIGAALPPPWAVKGLIDREQGSGKAPSRASRKASNPLVSTRAHLVALSDENLFLAKSDVRSYWRLTALDTYVNDQWTAGRGTYREEPSQPAGPTDRTVQITLQGLTDTWLPVQRPTGSVTGSHPDGVEATVAFDRYSGSVLLDDLARPGDTYQVVVLDESTALGEPLEFTQRTALLDLPNDLSPAIAELARTTTAVATNDSDRMLLLQRFFRSQFAYDLDVAKTSSLGIDQFLFEVRRGYCEQFASSFAVMARTLGIPSRVAIGFIPGTLTDNGYQVRGQDAHAWPEVFIDGRWKTYEPTPGRGTADGSQPTPTTAPPTTTAPSTTVADQAPTTTSDSVNPDGGVEDPPADPVNGFPVDTILRLLAAAASLIGLWFLPWLIRRFRSTRDVIADSDAVDPGVARAWRGLEDDLAWAGSARAPSQPIGQWLRRLQQDRRPQWSAIAEVATDVEAARYGADQTGGASNAELVEKIAALRQDTVKSLSARRRLARWLSFRLQPRVGPPRRR